MPGDLLEMELPSSCQPDGMFIIEPKIGQGEPFCLPTVIEALDNKILIQIKENYNNTPVKVIKNSKPLQIRETTVDEAENEQFNYPAVRYFDKFKDTLPEPPIKSKTVEDKLKEIEFDTSIRIQMLG